MRYSFALALAMVTGVAPPARGGDGSDVRGDEPGGAPAEVPAAARAAGEEVGENDEELGAYERNALRRALDAMKLDVVAEPEGKVVRRIHVVNLEAFSEDGEALAWLNNLRRTTREDVIAREVLLRPGESWDAETVAETRRKLKDPRYSSLVVIRPVRPEDQSGGEDSKLDPDEVDLLVVTRDVWSLRLTTTFESQRDVLSSLRSSLVETNFLGFRKLAALQFKMDLGAYSVGPLYIDPNVAGSRLEVLAQGAAIFSRETGALEGSRSALRIAYPLWSLDRRWGGSISFAHEDSIERSFEGTSIRRYDAPETPGDDALPWAYRRRELDVDSEVVRSFRRGVMHRVGLGHQLQLQRPAVLDEFPGDDEQRAAFERDVLPRSELASALYARYRLFEPEYAIYRDLDTFDLREERRVGPDFRLRIAAASAALGSEATFLRGRSRIGWGIDVAGDGLVSVALESEARLESGELIDNEVKGKLTLASPRILDAARMVARLDGSARIRETSNRFYTLGGLTGLRGYPIGAYTGTRRVRTNLEARTVGVPLWLLRVGAVAFWDAGHAADRVRELSLRHDVGVGIRWLTPQFSRFVFRVDWVTALQGPSAGFPGRISAGGGQVF